jgi:formate dehydrogenase maturation protein FdhE
VTATLAPEIVTYERRRERARELAARWPHAAEVLGLYAALLDVQERAGTAAGSAGPSFEELPRWVAEAVAPAVVHVTAAVGPDRLASALEGLLYAGDLQSCVADWLTGHELPPAERYLARASCAPVLEALPGLMPRPDAADSLHCPGCGALPQVSVFTEGGEALVTGQRVLECSRCASRWSFPRMVCAGCGEADTEQLPIYADHETFPHLRADGCSTCGQYLITVDTGKDVRAVAAVDELAAIPLDLYVRDLGLRKVTANLIGI